jgi:hypothetical protein
MSKWFKKILAYFIAPAPMSDAEYEEANRRRIEKLVLSHYRKHYGE